MGHVSNTPRIGRRLSELHVCRGDRRPVTSKSADIDYTDTFVAFASSLQTFQQDDRTPSYSHVRTVQYYDTNIQLLKDYKDGSHTRSHVCSYAELDQG